jgi:hypothetical protein
VIREDTSRLNSPKMEYYREVYRDSPRWNGAESLDGKHLLIYCEQGLGDQIQFARYVPVVTAKYKCKITLHCSKELLRLFSSKMLTPVDVLDRDVDVLPQHNFHITSMSLPFALQEFDVQCSYLHQVSKMHEIDPGDEFYKIGIAWEGNPEHSNNDERNCPLKYFSILYNALKHSQKPVRLFSLQKEYHNPELLNDVGELEFYGSDMEDMLDTARLINSMDAVVCVDTALLHLAGTLKKPTWAMLSHLHDHRWVVKNWYDTITLVKQPSYGDWKWVMTEIGSHLKEITRV